MQLTYNYLYTSEGLSALHNCWLSYVADKQSDLIHKAQLLNNFLCEKFEIQQSREHLFYQRVAKIKRQYLQRYIALKTWKYNDSWKDLYEFKCLDSFLHTAEHALENFINKPDENLEKFCFWALYSPNAKNIRSKHSIFQLPRKFNNEYKIFDIENIAETVQSKNLSQRKGFNLSDPGLSVDKAQGQSNYCIKCHKTQKDSCRSGLKNQPEKQGCPLDVKISQMHQLYQDGFTLGALALVMVDNPLVPLTGHRICFDCVNACIFQKQEAVDTPGVESRILNEVLAFPYGAEIYRLLLQWNPLLSDPLPENANNKKILIVGMGPAGLALSHYLTRSGYFVTIIDGAKYEPLGQLPPQQLLKNFDIFKPLSTRTNKGFGGVAEYGITSRWNKNYLDLLSWVFSKNKNLEIKGGVFFGSSITPENYKEFGFEEYALCCGASKPNFLDIPNILAKGVRFAHDFLMALNQGAHKDSSAIAIDIESPVVVIGGGLTSIDAATEVLALLKSRGIKNPMVTLLTRKNLADNTALKTNPLEVQMALEAGIQIKTNCEPMAITTDNNGWVSNVAVRQNGHEENIPAKNVLVAIGTNTNIIDHPYVFGDADPTYRGSVVKALASAKYGYKKIIDSIHQKQHTLKDSVEKICTRGVVLKNTPVNAFAHKLILHAPFYAKYYRPGQFFKLQTYESKTKSNLHTEGIAMTPIAVDVVTGNMTFLLLKIGASSVRFSVVQEGTEIFLAGPFGSQSYIPVGKKILLLGGGQLNLAMLTIANAMKHSQNTITWFAAYKKPSDIIFKEKLQKLVPNITWIFQEPENSDEVSGTIIDKLEMESQNLAFYDHILCMGPTPMLKAVAAFLHKKNLRAIMNINIPMQCMMQGICGQCALKQKNKIVFSCQHQEGLSDFLNFEIMQMRCQQNIMQEAFKKEAHNSDLLNKPIKIDCPSSDRYENF